MQYFKEKVPIYSIKRLLVINFDSTARRPSRSMIVPKKFLGKQNGVANVPTLDEGSLGLINQRWKDRFKAI